MVIGPSMGLRFIVFLPGFGQPFAEGGDFFEHLDGAACVAVDELAHESSVTVTTTISMAM